MYLIRFVVMSIRFFPRRAALAATQIVWEDIGKCTKYFIDMHYRCGRLFQMYNRRNTLGTFSAFLKLSKIIAFIQAPIFYLSRFSICTLFCTGSVQSAILIAITKEGNILLSKCFLNHNDHHCLHHHGHPHNQSVLMRGQDSKSIRRSTLMVSFYV